MNYRLHSNFQKDNAMDQVFCKRHLDAMLEASSVGFKAFFKTHYTITECSLPCEDCLQDAYEAAISEG